MNSFARIRADTHTFDGSAREHDNITDYRFRINRGSAPGTAALLLSRSNSGELRGRNRAIRSFRWFSKRQFILSIRDARENFILFLISRKKARPHVAVCKRALYALSPLKINLHGREDLQRVVTGYKFLAVRCSEQRKRTKEDNPDRSGCLLFVSSL